MPKEKAIVKNKIIHFRVGSAVTEEIQRQLTIKPIVACECPNKFARKLLLDWVSGRIAYKDPEDREQDSAVLSEMSNINL